MIGGSKTVNTFKILPGSLVNNKTSNESHIFKQVAGFFFLLHINLIVAVCGKRCLIEIDVKLYAVAFPSGSLWYFLHFCEQMNLKRNIHKFLLIDFINKYLNEMCEVSLLANKCVSSNQFVDANQGASQNR